MVNGFAYGALFSYIAASPFVIQGIYGASPQTFSLLYGLNSLGMMIVGRVNGKLLVGRVRLDRALGVGLSVIAVAGTVLLLVAQGVFGDAGTVPVACCLFVMISALGLVLPNTNALALMRTRTPRAPPPPWWAPPASPWAPSPPSWSASPARERPSPWPPSRPAAPSPPSPPSCSCAAPGGACPPRKAAPESHGPSRAPPRGVPRQLLRTAEPPRPGRLNASAADRPAGPAAARAGRGVTGRRADHRARAPTGPDEPAASGTGPARPPHEPGRPPRSDGLIGLGLPLVRGIQGGKQPQPRGPGVPAAKTGPGSAAPRSPVRTAVPGPRGVPAEAGASRSRLLPGVLGQGALRRRAPRECAPRRRPGAEAAVSAARLPRPRHELAADRENLPGPGRARGGPGKGRPGRREPGGSGLRELAAAANGWRGRTRGPQNPCRTSAARGRGPWSAVRAGGGRGQSRLRRWSPLRRRSRSVWRVRSSTRAARSGWPDAR